MSASKTQESWTEPQLKYIQFLARGKKDRNGDDFTEGEFAKALDVDPATLWRWKQKDGFAAALFEASLKELAIHLPGLNAAMMGKASGQPKFKNADPKAYLALLRQYEILKSDKIDHTTNGKDMPVPILGTLLEDVKREQAPA